MAIVAGTKVRIVKKKLTKFKRHESDRYNFVFQFFNIILSYSDTTVWSLTGVSLRVLTTESEDVSVVCALCQPSVTDQTRELSSFFLVDTRRSLSETLRYVILHFYFVHLLFSIGSWHDSYAIIQIHRRSCPRHIFQDPQGYRRESRSVEHQAHERKRPYPYWGKRVNCWLL